MPIPGARYGVTTTKTGKKIRLAFRGGNVVEAKNLKTGATHTPSEFAADRAKSKKKKKKAKAKPGAIAGMLNNTFGRKVS